MTENRIGAAFTPPGRRRLRDRSAGHRPGWHGQGAGQCVDGPTGDHPLRQRVDHLKVRLPLSINLVVDLRVDRLRYDVTGVVPLDLTVRAVEPLSIHIDVDTPRPRDAGRRGLTRAGRDGPVQLQVDDEIKRVIAATSHSRSDAGDPSGVCHRCRRRTRQGDADLTGVIGAASVESGERRRRSWVR